MVTTKNGITGRVIALSAAEVKIIDATYETRWVLLADVVAESSCRTGQQKVSAGARR